MQALRKLLVVLLLFAASCASPTTPDAQPTEREPEAPITPLVPVEPPDGGELYGRICVTCHGATGDGQGLEQELFSFGAPESEWTNGPTVDGILHTLADGVHHTSMQAFPEYAEAEQRALAAYVLELRARLEASD